MYLFSLLEHYSLSKVDDVVRCARLKGSYLGASCFDPVTERELKDFSPVFLSDLKNFAVLFLLKFVYAV